LHDSESVSSVSWTRREMSGFNYDVCINYAADSHGYSIGTARIPAVTTAMH